MLGPGDGKLRRIRPVACPATGLSVWDKCSLRIDQTPLPGPPSQTPASLQRLLSLLRGSCEAAVTADYKQLLRTGSITTAATDPTLLLRLEIQASGPNDNWQLGVHVKKLPWTCEN